MCALASTAEALSSYNVDTAMTRHVSKLSLQKKGAAGHNAFAVGGSLPARGLI